MDSQEEFHEKIKAVLKNNAYFMKECLLLAKENQKLKKQLEGLHDKILTLERVLSNLKKVIDKKNGNSDG